MRSGYAQKGEPLLESPSLTLFTGLLGDLPATRLLAQLDQALAWQRPTLHLYGREHAIPRRQLWMGDPDTRYRYSGRDFLPEPWHPAVAALRDRVVSALAEADTPARFNSVLLNRYAGGEERMGWHSDDEPELGPDPLIAAMSLGAERPLRFRWKDRSHEPFNVWLPHDSLLVMGAGVQSRLQHALLPRQLPGLRISLTFRLVKPRS
ncbi:MAG: alpha-ketoglutarate-dependent dioxygenase AlkB [Halomonas sp.]|uniref:alpha-ketoglutarate-dependent dioxygenase AlkB family protein n=1 Tax=Halomonas sp. TaxID=1486246 RepID=UPI002ACD8C3D|nr:alpha-ketoglutarate-dependent dioxygenase AlkB [Halomonas sp.]MDZ7852820.1 alpha-ketoglutarate-dependent dioxygenase AlkB [Halomonas sp.]